MFTPEGASSQSLGISEYGGVLCPMINIADSVRACSRRLQQHLVLSRRNHAAGGFASVSDVTTAYRLLLGREPDREGRRHYFGRVSSGTLTLKDLAAELLNSAEFSHLHRQFIDPQRSTLAEVATDDFVIMVDTDDWAVGASIAVRRVHEPEVTAALRSLICPGSVFVDVGANVGWFSLLGARIVGPSGKVIAIEPNPHNCALLKQSCTRNALTNIEVVVGAAADAKHWFALETDASNGRILPLGSIDSTAEPIKCSYVVPAFTLDQILSDRGVVGAVSAVKVDVEGVEDLVFRGAEQLLTSTKPAIIFEWFPQALRDAGGVDPVVPISRLRDHGYAISIVGYPTSDDSRAGLSNEEIEAVRLGSGRENLDLLARHP